MLKLAIGPVVNTPSWNWVGFDTGRELAKYFSVNFFADQIPPSDVAIVVKRPLRHAWADIRARTIYLPIDHYRSPRQIQDDQAFLTSCSAIVCHSECLMPYFASYCANVLFAEHHGRYTLPQMTPYRRDGYILWIGGCQHLPYLLKWVEQYPLPLPLKILTDIKNTQAYSACFRLAEQLNVKLHMTDACVNGHAVHMWSEKDQRRLMQEAKAAVDTKGGAWLGTFQWPQYTKPPTKGQKFISSGIPFAATDDSYCFDYFKRRGFILASPRDSARWLSYEYWCETARFGAALRRELSLPHIGLYYKRLIETVAAI